MTISSDQHTPSTFRTVLRILEGLNGTNEGKMLYEHIEHSLRTIESRQLAQDQLYVDLLKTLINALEDQYAPDNLQVTKLRLMEMGLGPTMPLHELKRLKVMLQQLVDELKQQTTDTHDPIKPAFDTLIAGLQRQSTDVEPNSALQKHEGAQKPSQSDIQQPNSSPPQIQWNDTRKTIQTLKNNLNDQVHESISFNSELARLIKQFLDTVRKIDTKENLEMTRLSYLQRCIDLIKSHQELSTKFDAVRVGLNEIELDSQSLDKELSRIHHLSLTDELTNLPNRRALLQNLEDEVARSQRYGYPLSLAIIDLDKFKPINDTFGHAAGDIVLKHFAENALSVFRHHDIFARYGGEEFAVLLPNTEVNGAVCALKKIQKQLCRSYCCIDGDKEILAPTFSAGIALYNPGESPFELIKRADTAMYRAKQAGRNRIEIHTMGSQQSAPQVQQKQE